jgi:hypothetical protein
LDKIELALRAVKNARHVRTPPLVTRTPLPPAPGC